MATITGNAEQCKKQIKEVLDRIKEGRYKIINTEWQGGIGEIKPVEDETGVRIYKRICCDSLTINYIDKEQK